MSFPRSPVQAGVQHQAVPGLLLSQEHKAVRFAGYAAVFDRVDRGGDVVRRGAFGRLPRDVPLLWQHEAGRTIGRVEYLKEDRRGLRVIGRVEDRRAAAFAGSRRGEGIELRLQGSLYCASRSR